MGDGTKYFYEFGPYRIDPERNQLLRDDEPVALAPKTFETLLILVRHSESTVSKDELMKELWPDTFVEDANLTQHIAMLRKALGETAQEHRYIVTLPGRGYRFAEQVRRVSGDLVSEDRSRSTGVAKLSLAGRHPLRTALVLLGAAVIAGFVFAIYLARLHVRSASPNTRVMLAVLPFQNLSNDPEQDYFSDGLTEETVTDLGALSPGQLGVIARTSVMAYKQSRKTLGQIGQELGVDYILEGSARRDARRVRISAQLIRVKDQTHVWAQSFDRDLADYLGVQSELGTAIAQQVQVTLVPQHDARVRKNPVDPEAYDDYLKGLYLWNKFTPEALMKSIKFYQQAIEKDPGYAQAYAGLAESYQVLMNLSVLAPAEAYPKSEATARKAVELDSGDSQAHSALGWQMLEYDRDLADAEREFRRAIELNPSNPDAYDGLASYFAVQAQFDESVVEMRKARELDPLSPIVNSELGRMLFYARQYDQGIQQLYATISLDPDFPAAHYYLMKIYEARGLYEEAYEEFFKLQTPGGKISEPLIEIQKIHAKSGWTGVWQKSLAIMLHERATGKVVSAYDIAENFLALGKEEQALDWLGKAADEHSNWLTYLNVDPRFDRLHSNARFQDLLRHIHIPPSKSN